MSYYPKKIVTYWLYLGITLVLSMVVIGGMTRLTHSGLSMVHWSFTGSLPPMTDEAWNVEFEEYKASPEYKEVHTHFTLPEFQSIYWWEYIHRMFGRFIGVVFIIPFLFFLWKRWIPKSMLKHFILILCLGAFQALLGWFMVKSGLIDIPRVSHYRLAAHLSTAFIACVYIFWVALKYRHYGREQEYLNHSSKLPLTLGVLIFIQIIYGAFVAGLRAGWIHNTWPLMDGALIAPGVTALDPLVSNFVEGRSGVQFVHRTIGLLIVLLSGYVWMRSKDMLPAVRRAARLSVLFVLVQFILGVTTLLLQVPIALGVLHQVFALVLLLSVVYYYYTTRYQLVSNEGS